MLNNERDGPVPLVMDDGIGNIVAEGCDAGIRLGESLSQNMVAVPVTRMLRMAVVGSPQYFARRPAPRTPSDLVQHVELAVRGHIEDGSLVEVLARWCAPFSGFHLYIPSRAQMPAKMRAFIDFLVEKRGRMGEAR